MNGNLRVGTLFGIPFFVSTSWFLVLALVTWNYSQGLAFQFPGLGGGLTWLLGLVAALLLFASVLAHELGHSFAARTQGIGVKSITLFLFGGLANLERESDSPSGAFWVAIAGPLVSFGLFALLVLTLIATPLSGPLAAITQLLAWVNLGLALFNLIPGLPLDGGNILKAIVWKVTGNPYKGVVFASRVGQIIGGGAIALGLLSIFGLSSVGNFWTLLVGWFLFQNAGRAAQSATIQEQLKDFTAEDAVTVNSPIVSARQTLREFADNAVLSPSPWRKYLVTDDAGQLMGAIAVDDLQPIPREQWTQTLVGQLVHPTQLQTVPAEQSLLEVMGVLETQGLNTLAVIQSNGLVVGLLERSSVLRLLQGPMHPSAT